MNVKRSLVTAGIAAVASIGAAAAVPGTALADSADTPVGHLTAEKVTCADLGERVKVTVTGAIADAAQYKATAPRGGLVWSEEFTTDASGVLSTQIHNVSPDAEPFIGLATITVTAGGQSGQVTIWLDCPSNKD